LIIEKVYKKKEGQSKGWLKDDIFYHQPLLYRKLPIEKRATFTLRTLTIHHINKWNELDNLQAITGERQSNDQCLSDILCELIVGWHNFRTASGKLIEFSENPVNKMPILLRWDLYYAIEKNSILTDDERDGLRILAGIHSGNLDGYSCEGCAKTPGMTEKRGMIPVYEKDRFMGCDAPKKPVEWTVFTEEIGQDTYEYYSCPVKLIPLSLNRFMGIYNDLQKNTHNAPRYEDKTIRYNKAEDYYESEMVVQSK